MRIVSPLRNPPLLVILSVDFEKLLVNVVYKRNMAERVRSQAINKSVVASLRSRHPERDGSTGAAQPAAICSFLRLIA